MTLSTAPLTIIELLSDGELITASRGGDGDAFAELYRRHRPAALAAARSLTRSRADSEDLVAEGFARVLKAVQGGGGPDLAFRAYLMTAMRNTFYDRVRRTREDPTEQIEDSVNQALVEFADDTSDRALAAKAFATLPERWQMVLWHTEVEGRTAAEIAPLIGLAPNAVSALAYRAREGLRQAYLQVHLQGVQSGSCAACVENLGAYVRDGLSARDRTKVDAHLAECDQCKTLLIELQETNSTLRAALIPALVGVPAVAFLGKLAPGGVAGWYQRQPPRSQAAAGVGLGTAVVAASVAVILAVGGGPSRDRMAAAPDSLDTTTTARQTTVAPSRPSTTMPATTSASTTVETVFSMDTTPMVTMAPPLPLPLPMPRPITTSRPITANRPITTSRPITPSRPTTGPGTATTAPTASATTVANSNTSSTTTSSTAAPAAPANLVVNGTATLTGSTMRFTLTNTGGLATKAMITVAGPSAYATPKVPTGLSATGYTIASATVGVSCVDAQTCSTGDIAAKSSVEIALTITKASTDSSAISTTPLTVTLLATDVNGKTVPISATGDVRREWRASGGAVQVAGMAGAGTLSIRPGSSTLLIAWRENSAGTDAQLKEIVVDGTDVAVVGAATPGQPGTYYASVDSSALQSPSGATTQSIEVGGGFIVDWGVVAIFPGNGTVVVPGIFGETTPAGPRAGDSVKVRALVLGDSVSSLQLGGSKALVSGFVGSLGMRVSDASMPPIVVNSTDGESPLGLLVYQY